MIGLREEIEEAYFHNFVAHSLRTQVTRQRRRIAGEIANLRRSKGQNLLNELLREAGARRVEHQQARRFVLLRQEYFRLLIDGLGRRTRSSRHRGAKVFAEVAR